MKNKKSIIGLAFLFSILTFLLIFGDLLALLDIGKDYVSTQVLDSQQINIANDLPEWTSAKLEWTFIKISMLLKSVFMIIIIIALTKVIKLLKL
jgi:hypothetical protein